MLGSEELDELDPDDVELRDGVLRPDEDPAKDLAFVPLGLTNVAALDPIIEWPMRIVRRRGGVVPLLDVLLGYVKLFGERYLITASIL